MNKKGAMIAAIALTVVASVLVTSYLVNKATIATMANKVVEVEAFNDIGRIENWDILEQLLNKGCHKEALEFVRLERSSILSSLKRKMNNDSHISGMVNDRNSEVAARAVNHAGLGSYTIPTCQ